MHIHSRWPLLLGALLLLQASSGAAQGHPSPAPGIWIADASGQLHPVQPSPGFLAASAGRREAVPAGLVVELDVESFARSATGAMAASELAARRVVRATSSLAGASGVSIGPASFEVEYERASLLGSARERPKRAGFRAITRVIVEAPDPRRLGLVLDAASGAGTIHIVRIAPRHRLSPD